MIRSTLLAGAAAALLLAPVALADDRRADDDDARARPFLRMMMLVDLDGDGLVSADEAAGRAAMTFGMLDDDGNDVLTDAEFVSPWMGEDGEAFMHERRERMPREMRERMERRRGQMQARRAEVFAAMDADKNGSVTRAEFVEAHRLRFVAADADGDGQVTVWEWRAQAR